MQRYYFSNYKQTFSCKINTFSKRKQYFIYIVTLKRTYYCNKTA